MGQKSLTWIRLIVICYCAMVDILAIRSDVVWRVSRLPPWSSSWILELNDSAILNLHFTTMPPIKFPLNLTFKEFQDGHHGGHLGYLNGTILAILNLCVTVMPPIKFQLNRTGLRRCRLKNFKMAVLAAILNNSRVAILDIGTERF